MALISGGTTVISSGGIDIEVGGGKLLQVVQSTKTNAVSYSLQTGSLSTLWSQSITPSATSSKILIKYTVYFGLTQNTAIPYTILRRGSTDIFKGDSNGNRQRVTACSGYQGSPQAHQISQCEYLDSPSTTSAVTYNIMTGGFGGRTYYLNMNYEDSGAYITTGSSFTLMEIGT